MPEGWQDAPCFTLSGGTYVVTGAPVVVAALTTSITDSIVLLLVAALAGDGGDAGARLPQPPAPAAAGDRAGRGGAHLRRDGAGRRLADDGLDRGAAGADRPRRSTTRSSSSRASTRSGRAPAGARPPPRRPRGRALGAPTIATAGAATAAGFLVLLLSPVPMVRGFGLLLVIGIALAFACALTAGFAAMVLGEEGDRVDAAGAAAPGSAAWLASAGRGARDLVLDAWLRGGRRGAAAGRRRPRVLRRRAVAWAIDVLVLAGVVWLLAGRGLTAARGRARRARGRPRLPRACSRASPAGRSASSWPACG